MQRDPLERCKGWKLQLQDPAERNLKGAGFLRARSGGLTTLNVMPGSGHLMSGQTTYLKMRRAESKTCVVM